MNANAAVAAAATAPVASAAPVTPVEIPVSTDRIIAGKARGVGYLKLNQPEKLNAISYEMWVAIAEVMASFGDDDDVRVVVMSGEGARAFSAGADISEFSKNRSTAAQVERYEAASRAAYDAITHFPKPVIARIEGYCVGGGLAVALCADLRIASEDSRFGIPAAKLGLGYSHKGLRPLVDLVGPTYVKEILFTAKRFAAPEAQRMGLVNQVVQRSEIDAFVEDYAETIAANAPLTVMACKTVVAELLKDPEERDTALCDRVVDACFASEDYKEGRAAFMEKRAPRFTGR